MKLFGEVEQGILREKIYMSDFFENIFHLSGTSFHFKVFKDCRTGKSCWKEVLNLSTRAKNIFYGYRSARSARSFAVNNLRKLEKLKKFLLNSVLELFTNKRYFCF